MTRPGQSTLDSASHASHEIVRLWWGMTIGAGIGFAVVCGLLLLGWWRRGRVGIPFGGGDRAATAWILGLGVATPLVVLVALFVWSDVFVIDSTAAPKRGSTRLTVDVIGHQWWWEVRYPGTKAVTANEIHVPVGERVLVVATTDDVIHSFWVPELNRKIDMVPGRRNTVLLDADRAGVFRGQCAEFCGLQHAHMAFLVYADPPNRVPRLARGTGEAGGSSREHGRTRGNAGLRPRAVCRLPPDPGHGRGRHRRPGPDAPRRSLDDRRRHAPQDGRDLAGWIRDPQHVKPGNRMPAVRLPVADVTRLVAYLRSLH